MYSAFLLIHVPLSRLISQPIRKEVFEKRPAVLSWFDSLLALPPFQKICDKFGRGLDGCKAAASSLISYGAKEAAKAGRARHIS